MTNIEIVPATSGLLIRFFGHVPQKSVRAIVAMQDDEPIAVSGLYLDRARQVLFSEWRPEILIQKKAIVRMMRETRRLIQSTTLPVHAVASEDSNDGIILRHLGFCEQEGVFVWHS